MAYVKDTASGKYQAQVYVKDPFTNKRKRLYKTFDSKKKAKEWASNKKEESDSGNLKDSQNKTVADILLEWLEEHATHVEENTHNGYENKVKSHLIPVLGHINIDEFKRVNVKNYFQYKRKKGRLDGKEGGLSENSLKKHYVVLKLAMDYAKNSDIIAENPVTKYRAPRPEKSESKAMSEEEINKLIKVAKNSYPWMYRFITIDLLTGLRRSEISALTWKNINLNGQKMAIKQVLSQVKGKGTILKEKTKNETSNRIVPFSDDVKETFIKHKKEQDIRKKLLKEKYDDSIDFVFAKEYGGHYGIRFFNEKFNEMLDKANLPQEYGIHTLRHTFATICIKYGISKEKLMAVLGHSSYSTTVDTYGHLDVESQREATDTVSNVFNI